ncbi:acyltransferase [Paraglaciecola arctica]|uniref:acyltransferase n=1 Tax=Paraglaciecola arctica TaxID=1128911 RepID=UPI0020905A86|nr:acyltransferase [Paraglaciecola arctica]
MDTKIFEPGYYTEEDLRGVGFKSLGRNVAISKNCTILGIPNISIGDNVRIDSYCSIFATGSGFLTLGSYIHIGGYSALSAGSGIVMEDFSGLSQGVKIYSRTDDYSGKFLTNPTVPQQYTGVVEGQVSLGKHVIVGAGSVILPGTTIGEGASVGAMSLVTKDLDEWNVYFGSPAKKLKRRSKELLILEEQLVANKENT